MKNFINRALVAKKKLKLFFALFAMLALNVGNAWAETVFSDDFANVGTTANANVSARTGWSGFTKCYGQNNSGIRMGTGSATGSITKTAMTNISGTTTLTVTFYLAKYNNDSGKMNITISGGGTATTTQFTPAGNAGVTSTTSKATWEDKYKCTFTINNATSATTINFATSSNRLILGPITIEDASSTGGGETPGEDGGEDPVVPNPDPEIGGETWTLVTNASDLKADDQIVIAATGSNYALGPQANNNRTAVAITKTGNNITWTTDVQIITLETGKVANTFAFNTGSAGYLYAASSTANHLKTKTTLDDNGSWTISIASSGVATIKAQGTYTHNWIRKNSSDAIFSCYGSGQSDVAIYKKVTSSGSGSTEPVDSLTAK